MRVRVRFGAFGVLIAAHLGCGPTELVVGRWNPPETQIPDDISEFEDAGGGTAGEGAAETSVVDGSVPDAPAADALIDGNSD